MLEIFYRKLLKQVQGLPDTTANAAVYLLLDTVPLEAQIHMRILGLLGNITRLEVNHPLRALALRQLSVKDKKSASWFMYTQAIAEIYEINLFQIITAPWPKLTWKRFVKNTITEYWQEQLRAEAETKTSLNMWLIRGAGDNIKIWSACCGKTHLVEATITRLRMLTGRYQIQTARAKFNQFEVDTTCPLCKKDPETMTHFLMECESLEQVRCHKLTSLQLQLESHKMRIPDTPYQWSLAILNGGIMVDENNACKSVYADVESACSRYCHYLHRQRDIMLNCIIMESS